MNSNCFTVTRQRQMRRASRGSRPVVVVAVPVESHTTSSVVAGRLVEPLVASTGNPRFSKEENQEARWEPGHDWGTLQPIVSFRAGQGSPPYLAYLTTSLILFLVPPSPQLTLHLPHAFQSLTLQSTKNPRFSKEENQEARCAR